MARLLRGERNVSDLYSLSRTSGLRSRPCDVTEIGDFAANRDERDKGVVMKRSGDPQTSARIWVQQMLGISPTIEVARPPVRDVGY